MDCPYCKTPLLSGMTICPRCKYDTALPDGGEEHVLWVKEEQERKSRQEALKGSQPYGVGWLNFYINWRFPIVFVIGFITLASSFITVFISSEQSLPIVYLIFVWDVLSYAFHIPVFVLMKKRSRLGYDLNVILLVVEAINLALRQGFRGENFTASFLFGLLFALLIWFLPNYVYFKHREYLFSGTSSQNQVEKTVNLPPVDTYTLIPPQKMLFCRTCGAKLEPNAKYCSNCGQNLEELYFKK